jgi:hypothetical protein
MKGEIPQTASLVKRYCIFGSTNKLPLIPISTGNDLSCPYPAKGNLVDPAHFCEDMPSTESKKGSLMALFNFIIKWTNDCA